MNPTRHLSTSKGITFTLILILSLINPTNKLLAKNETQPDQVEVVSKKGKLYVEMPSQNISIKFDNKAYFDAVGHMNGFEDGEISFINGDAFHLPNGFTIPMLYLAVHADLYNKWSLNVELDLGGGKLKYRTIYAGYKLGKETQLLIGNLKVPASMSANVVMSNLFYHTKPIDMILMTQRRMGAAIYHYANRYSLAGGVFSVPMDDFVNLPRGTQEMMLSGRATYNLIQNDHTLLFAGVNAHHLRAGQEKKGFKFQSGLESSLAKDKFLVNHISDAKYRNTLGGELGLSHDRMIATLEYMTTKVVRNNEPSQRFHGANARLSYMISGNPRTLKRDGVDFASYPDVSKHSATEVGINSSYLNLNGNEHQGRDQYTIGVFANHFFNYNIAMGVEAKYSKFGKDALLGGDLKVVDSNFNGIETWQLFARMIVNF